MRIGNSDFSAAGALVTRLCTRGASPVFVLYGGALWWAGGSPHMEIITGSHPEQPANGLRSVAYRSINPADAHMYKRYASRYSTDALSVQLPLISDAFP